MKTLKLHESAPGDETRFSAELARVNAPSRNAILLAVSICIVSVEGASAIVGGAAATEDGIARSVVTIVGSRGTFCSGALIAPDIVLSAAHCIAPSAVYKIIIPGETPPRLLDVKRVATHPQFNVQGILAHRASADVACCSSPTRRQNQKCLHP